MNYRLVAKYLGHFIIAIGLLMVPSALWAIYFQEWHALRAFAESIGAILVIGAVLWFAGRNAPNRMFQREGLALVGVGWLATAAVGSLPYIFSGVLDPVDAYFETMSGLTTTGSTVLVDIEAVYKSVLFWRSFTHWLGGMGIIVLFIAVLPYLGAGGKQLFKSESPGPDPRGLSPRIKDTASILYRLYVGLTVLQTILLMIAGMSFYDALCHTFGTLATGGFSTRNASIAAYDSVYIEIIIIVFMVLAGTNFALYYSMLRGEYTSLFKNTEWRLYMAILVIATIVITLNLLGLQGHTPGMPEPATREYSPLEALRVATFQVVSIMTTTGFGTDNFENWPYFSRMILMTLMLVGGCAGSTGGGIKVVRIIMLFKLAYRRLESTFRPKTIRAIRINDQVVEEDIQKTVYGFFVLYGIVLVSGSLYMAALGLPFETGVTAVVTALNNIGPGLQFVGPVENFAFIPDSGKVVLSLCMAMGRLELYSICVMFIPSFWKHG